MLDVQVQVVVQNIVELVKIKCISLQILVLLLHGLLQQGGLLIDEALPLRHHDADEVALVYLKPVIILSKFPLIYLHHLVKVHCFLPAGLTLLQVL